MNVSSSDPPPAGGPAASDRSLLARFRKGDEDAATALYVRYASRLEQLATRNTARQLAARFDPDDVVQSVFRTFFRRAADGMYDVPAGEELWQLLLVIALNKVRRLCNFHRTQKRDVRTTIRPESFDAIEASAQGGGEQSFAVLQMVVQETINELPGDEQGIIEQRVGGMTVDEIATNVTRSKRSVERILQRFRSRLQISSR